MHRSTRRPVSRRAVTRRWALAGAAGTLLLPRTALHAARSVATPNQTEGPFYPTGAALPADRDADLLTLRGRPGRPEGDTIYVKGRVLTVDGKPVPGADVQIWQANAKGVYNHPRDGNDPTFQGFGTVVTDAAGRYRFRTLRPAGYGSIFFRRPPHIHFKVLIRNEPVLTTQMYFADGDGNDRDSILNGVDDAAARASLIVPFRPSPDIEPESRSGTFNIVIATPA